MKNNFSCLNERALEKIFCSCALPLLCGFFVFLFFTSNAFATTYYISNTGSDTNNSGTDPSQPWQTITKVNATTLTPGDSILFNKGDIFYGAVTISQSGKSGNPITYGSYGSGNKPKIKGTNVITGWTQHSGNIYKATLTHTINQMFIDGERVAVSRYPNVGAGENGGQYILIDSLVDDTTITDSALSGVDWTNSTAILLGVPWGYEAKTITSSSGSTITITNDVYGLSTGEPFFIVNNLATLDGANQWAYDETTNTVYLWTPNGDSPSGYTVEVSTEDYGFYGLEKSYVTIENLSIENFEKDSIYFAGVNTNNIIIDGNNLLNAYECGVHFYDNTNRFTVTNTDVTITNNLIEGNNRSSIKLEGTNFAISHNTIRDVALIQNIGLKAFIDPYNTATGMILYPINNSTVSYNTLSNIGYNGIMFFGTNTNVEYNKVSSTCVTLHDCGGIYTHMESPGSYIRNNIISGNHSDFGLYLDATVTGITVADNTSFDNARGMHANNLVDVVIRGNTFYNNSKVQLSIREYTIGLNSNNLVTENILFSPYFEQATLETTVHPGSDLETTFNYNYYLNPIDPMSINRNSLAKFQETGQGVGAKEFTPGAFKYFETTETLSANHLSNGTFNTSTSNWYASADWVRDSPLDGGALGRTFDSTYELIQSYNLNIPVSGTKQFLISFDTIAPGDAVAGFIDLQSKGHDFGRFVADSTRRHFKFLATISSDITQRLGFGVSGSIGDVMFLDNVTVEEITATTFNPLYIFELYYNDTTSVKSYTLTNVYKDIDGESVSSPLTLQPFTSKILINQGEELLVSPKNLRISE